EWIEWLRTHSAMPIELTPDERIGSTGVRGRVTFTGRLDHRYAPFVLAALAVLVVPSVLDEAFAMVAAEGAAAGALPLVARHSGLAEVAGVLEREAGEPGLFSFTPGPGAATRIALGVDRLLGLSRAVRGELRRTVRATGGREWTGARQAWC